MLLVGYGDVFAVTHLGRFVSIAACIWGVFLLSLFVVVLNNYVEMNKEESSVCNHVFQHTSHVSCPRPMMIS